MIKQLPSEEGGSSRYHYYTNQANSSENNEIVFQDAQSDDAHNKKPL